MKHRIALDKILNRMKWEKRLAPFAKCLSAAAFLSLGYLTLAHAAPLQIAIEFDPAKTETNSQRGVVAFQAALKKFSQPVNVIVNSRLREITRGALAGELDVLWVPSSIAATAVADKRYEVLGYDGHMAAMALLVKPEIKTFGALAGKRLYLPQEDSPASLVGTALLSDNHLPLTTFGSVFTTGSYEVSAFAVEQGLADVAALPQDIAQQWIAEHPGKGRILETSKPIPGQTLVVKKSLDASTKSELASWFAKNVAGVPELLPVTPAVWHYVTGLTHYTPDSEPGVKSITAQEVESMAKRGVVIVDVRSHEEYATKHIPGARLVPYIESSPRVVGANLASDIFDLTALNGTKDIILYCNGAECWKSFKAAAIANASKKFISVSWFRGGLPEWERAGFPVSH